MAIINFLQSNPLYAAGLAILILFFVISLITKAIKLMIVAIVLNIGYGYHLYDISEAYQKVNENIESAVDVAKDVLDE